MRYKGISTLGEDETALFERFADRAAGAGGNEDVVAKVGCDEEEGSVEKSIS